MKGIIKLLALLAVPIAASAVLTGCGYERGYEVERDIEQPAVIPREADEVYRAPVENRGMEETYRAD
jgi:hypothetical protein